MNTFVLSAILAAVVFSGCTQTVDFSEPYHLVGQEKITAALDPSLTDRVETSSILGGLEKGTYKLATAVALVFQNDQSSPVKLALVSSTLETVPLVSAFETGTVSAHYRLLVKRTVGDSSALVEGQGEGFSYLNSFNAVQEAIEKALIDLGVKIRNF
jgi:hypothetical protein